MQDHGPAEANQALRCAAAWDTERSPLGSEGHEQDTHLRLDRIRHEYLSALQFAGHPLGALFRPEFLTRDFVPKGLEQTCRNA